MLSVDEYKPLTIKAVENDATGGVNVSSSPVKSGAASIHKTPLTLDKKYLEPLTSLSSAPFSTSRSETPGKNTIRGNWTEAEDELLRNAVAEYLGKNWKRIAERIPDRSDVQCLHRWQKVLRPGLIKGPWTPEVRCYMHELCSFVLLSSMTFLGGSTGKRLGRGTWCQELVLYCQAVDW